MSNLEQVLLEFHPGDNLTLDEFLGRWEAMPSLKFAELIRGVVFMPPPLTLDHGTFRSKVATWLGFYAAYTPGVCAGNNATWLMAEDSASQPDVALRILPEHGGQSGVQGRLAFGASELAAETCVSSASYDLHQKLKLYEESGVLEYPAVLVKERQVRWHRLVDGKYQFIQPDADNVIRSVVFPGLWLDVAGLRPAMVRGCSQFCNRG